MTEDQREKIRDKINELKGELKQVNFYLSADQKIHFSPSQLTVYRRRRNLLKAAIRSFEKYLE